MHDVDPVEKVVKFSGHPVQRSVPATAANWPLEQLKQPDSAPTPCEGLYLPFGHAVHCGLLEPHLPGGQSAGLHEGSPGLSWYWPTAQLLQPEVSFG